MTNSAEEGACYYTLNLDEEEFFGDLCSINIQSFEDSNDGICYNEAAAPSSYGTNINS